MTDSFLGRFMDPSLGGEQETTETIDVSMLQSLQDLFCRANQLYLVCCEKTRGMLTRVYGTEEELEELKLLVPEEDCKLLVERMEHDLVETMIEQPLPGRGVRLCAVLAKATEQTRLVWLVIGVIREEQEEQNGLDHLMDTTKEHFYDAVELLSHICDWLFQSRAQERKAQTAVKEISASRQNLERELKRSHAMQEVLRMLESDCGFARLSSEIIRLTCESLSIDGGSLLRENVDDGTVDLICEHVRDRKYSALSKIQHLDKTELPFFTGRTYMISSDSPIPEAFRHYFKEHHLSAASFQPLEVNGKVMMYLCFFENGKTRSWETGDVRFIGDVRRVIQSELGRRIAKNSLASSYVSLEAILENTGCGIYVADYHTRQILYMNEKFKELFSRTIAAGKITELVFEEKETERMTYCEERYSVEEDRWLDVRKNQIDWVDGHKVSLCTFFDITDKKVYQKEIVKKANNDFLTGLLNRMRCELDLGKFIDKAKLEDTQGALLYLDLDDFKHINEGLGHQYGDVLLKAISHSISHVEGVENTCYRTGGDEFCVIVPDTMYRELERIVADISSVFTKPWFLKGEDYYCTMSMGIVCFPSDGDTVEDLIRKADIALLSAKKRGKNRIEYYSAKDGASAYRRLDLEKNMRYAAMDSCKEFEVYYQPIMDATGEEMRCCGAEALVRWNSAALGFIRPDDFIPLAEYLGLINPIGEYVLRNAAARCRYWNDMGMDFKVNVNLSVVQLLQNGIVKKIAGIVKETKINPQNLTLEVTESLAVNDMDRMKTILSRIKALGVKVALDDFGTGYSSLNHIRQMPLDVIKIDRCFIEHLGEDDFSDAFVKMVAKLARTIGVKICVEGVETRRQRDLVKKMKISMMQGYLFGKPMKLEEFEEEFLR